MNKEMKGKRIILREQREEDAPFFAYWFNQPQVMFQCGFEKPTDEEEVKTCINVDHKSENSVWFTITDLDGNIIGETGLLRMFPAWHQTDLTIIIPDPKMQHKGYGTEAIRIMLDMAFNRYEMHRVSIGSRRIEYRCTGILQKSDSSRKVFWKRHITTTMNTAILL